jgi:CRP-like cAMP-binding protein
MSENRCEQCVVRQFNALRALSKQDLLTISEAKQMHKIKKGELLFEQGSRLKGVYCVRSGMTKLSKISVTGKDQIVKLASKGEVLGQRSILNNEPSTLTAKALGDAEVCFIPIDALTSILHKNSDFSVELLRHMAHELDQADEVILSMSQLTARQRMAKILLFLYQLGCDSEGYFTVLLSREELASMTGIATESLIRLLSSFKKEGLIETKGRKIRILNSAELQNIEQDMDS